MKVKIDLSNQTLEYMDSMPYIQGTDTRNKLYVYIAHSSIPQTEGAFNIQIAYALQNGRTTIKMANTGATQETIDDILYDVIYFTAPKILTSLSGNFVATLILKVNSNQYKVNVLNTVLDSVEFETFESALEETEATILEDLSAMSTNIAYLQLHKADKINAQQELVAKSIAAKIITNRIETDSGDIEIEASEEEANIILTADDIRLLSDYNIYLGNLNNTLINVDNDGAYVTLKAYNRLILELTSDDLEFYKIGQAFKLFEINQYGALTCKDSSGNKTIEVKADGVYTPNPVYVNNKELAKKEYVDSADSTLQTNIDNEALARGNADTTLQTNINASGHSIDLTINSSDFKMYATLKDANNNVISTSSVIDLPLESVVVSGAYDDTTKKVVLTLENGSTIEFSVADLVAGLQTEITAQNKLSSDLVDDTNHTNKFVTASEKAQITTNANAITGIKDGTTLDSFADVETALAGKQDTLSGSTSIDITSNVVSVKDSYVESFFATDLEVQNMLSEVFN